MFKDQKAFTLLELLTAIALMLMLVAMVFPAFDEISNRTEQMNCARNLRVLHTAATSYIEDHNQWPQIRQQAQDTQLLYMEWLEAFKPYGLDRKSWICPTVQSLLNDPDIYDDEQFRLDYFASNFGPTRFAPFQHSKQPWFGERANVHGKGNLMIMPDGSITTTFEYFGVNGN